MTLSAPPRLLPVDYPTPVLSRRNPVKVPREERYFTNVRSAGQSGDEALQSHCEATVRRHAVFERLEVARKRLGILAGRTERGNVVFIAVQTLAARHDLHPTE